jgi:hypothetical protein
MGSTNDVLHRPALGQDVQLGMLYDVRTSTLFGGVSLWDDSVVNANAKSDTSDRIQNAEYTFSTSVEESRKNASLDVEGSIELDLKMVKVSGSAKYLADSKSSSHEARLDASYTIVRRTRRIPQETLASMKYEAKLDDPRFTHYVGEVIEGASATVSIVKSTSSEEESKKISGELQVKLVGVPVSGSAKVDYKTLENSDRENVKISYSGPLAESCTSWEDARRIAAEMPTKLKDQMNTLSYKLYPVDLVDSKARRAIRSIDNGLIDKTSAAIKNGTLAQVKLDELLDRELYKKSFPSIKKQISNFRTAFLAGQTEFLTAARTLLPELRDGNTNANDKISELIQVLTIYQQRISIAEEFIEKKDREAETLRTTVAALLADGFQNYLEGLKPGSLVGAPQARVLLSFGGNVINRLEHPLQKSITQAGSGTDKKLDDEGEDEDDGAAEEWFEDPGTVSSVSGACAALQSLRLRAPKEVMFGVASVNKAFRPGGKKTVATKVGDILLDVNSTTIFITGLLPKAPTAPKLAVKDQTITVSWEKERTLDEEQALPTVNYIVRYRSVPNSEKDSIFPRATANDLFVEFACKPSDSSVSIFKDSLGGALFDDCDYEVTCATKTIVGLSEWSPPTVCRTLRMSSVSSEMIKFYNANKASLSTSTDDATKWDLDTTGVRPSLYLGVTTFIERPCTDARYPNDISVRCVDVAPEFQPNLQAAEITDADKTMIIVFTGPSGAGKSTQINAFISYLFGAAVDDSARIMTIDDRAAVKTASVTQYVTCYRIRSLSPLFGGKTLLVIDTPGYADTRGLGRDNFVTAAMKDLFGTIKHVNAIVMTCKANETRTDQMLKPVTTFIFQLFAKNVRNCLRTVYTFSDGGAGSTHASLKELEWPVENGEINVNNSAFTIDLDKGNALEMRKLWARSMTGQFLLMSTLQRMPAVTTEESGLVTTERIKLEQRCRAAEKSIFETANEARYLIADVEALAGAIGKPPGTTIDISEPMTVRKDLQTGEYTTLCQKCNFTCHRSCAYSDDKDKIHCDAMTDGKCTYCPGRCSWELHHNAQYYYTTERTTRTIVPQDLIAEWNASNNSLEAGVLKALDKYAELQKNMTDEMKALAELTETVMSTALLHKPGALIEYVAKLIETARSDPNIPPEQVVQLTTAKNALLIQQQVQLRGKSSSLDSQTLVDVFERVKTEMTRRMLLKETARFEEEKKPSTLYNNLRDKLPDHVKLNPKAPVPLSSSALYPENLRSVVLLIKVMLTDGTIVAAITAPAPSA